MRYSTKNKKTSCRKLKAYQVEEKQASKDYHKSGFHKIARDETRHEKYFKGLRKERC